MNDKKVRSYSQPNSPMNENKISESDTLNNKQKDIIVLGVCAMDKKVTSGPMV